MKMVKEGKFTQCNLQFSAIIHWDDQVLVKNRHLHLFMLGYAQWRVVGWQGNSGRCSMHVVEIDFLNRYRMEFNVTLLG